MGRYSLEIELVRELGISTAAVYDRLYDLCHEKAERNADCHDGLFWVRIPVKDFHRVFPFLSTPTIAKALRRLREEGLVRVGHYDGAGIRGGRGSSSNWYATT